MSRSGRSLRQIEPKRGRNEKPDRVLGERLERWRLLEGTTCDQTKDDIFSKLRVCVGLPWKKAPDQISDEEFIDFSSKRP